MRNDKILKLVNQYNSLTSMGKVLEGMRILSSIDNLLTPMDDIISGNNCCTFRQLISDLLFID